MKKKKAALHNLGCKKCIETEAMQQILENAGYEIFTEYADVYGQYLFRYQKDRKSRQMLHKAKKMNPDAIVVGAGCRGTAHI